MSRQDETSEIVGLEEVSRAYAEAGFDETPPEPLDRAIRAHANRRRRERRGPFRLSPRHIAWAAAVVLSLSIVLQFGGLTPRFDTDGAQSVEDADDLSVESEAAGTEAAGRDGSDADLADAPRSPQSAPRGASSPRASDDAPTRATRRSATAPEARTEAAAAASQADRASAESAAVAGAGGQTDGCAQSDRATAESWLACLVGLRSERDADPENVRARTFENELAAFKEQYPDATLPPGLEVELP